MAYCMCDDDDRPKATARKSARMHETSHQRLVPTTLFVFWIFVAMFFFGTNAGYHTERSQNGKHINATRTLHSSA